MLFNKPKSIIVVGSGYWGARLAGGLSNRGHRVVVIDSQKEAFCKLPEDFKGNQIEGDVTDPGTLEKCGVRNAAAFVAATQNDNVNLMVAQIARCLMNVENVYVKLEDQSKERIIQGTDIKPICPQLKSVEDYAHMVGADCQKEAV